MGVFQIIAMVGVTFWSLVNMCDTLYLAGENSGSQYGSDDKQTGAEIVAVLFCFPKFLGTYLWVRWFCKDDKEGRRGLLAACVIDVIFFIA